MQNVQQQEFGPFLTNLFGDRYLHPINQLAFNNTGSRECFRKFFGDKFCEKNNLFVVIGSDSGLLLKYLSGLRIGNGTRILVVEFPQVMNRLGEVFDLRQLPENVFLVPADSWQGSLEEVNFTAYSYLDKITVLESIGAADGHFAEYKELFRDVRQALEDFNWRLKVNLGNKTFLIRQLENLAENRHPAVCLKDLSAGKAAAILGAGPSLDEALPWLLKHRDELIIIAVSRVSRRLLDVGLVPHIVVSVDPEYASFRVSREMLKLNPEVVLVQAYHAHPHLISSWFGRQLYLGPRLPWRSALNEENLEIHGPTVTNTAISMAAEMGFAKLILCGVDLCHTPEGYSHSQGNTERELGPSINNLHQRVETYAGDIAESPQGYFGAAAELAQQALILKQRGCQLVNMAAGAAKVEGVEYQPLEEIQFEGVGQSIQDMFHRVLPDDSVPWRLADLQRTIEEIRCVRIQLQKIERLAEEARQCNDGLFGRNNKKADFKYKKRMDQIEKQLNRDFSNLVPLVKHYGFDLFSKIVRPDPAAEWTDEEIEATGRQYYQAYLLSSRELGQELEKAARRLAGRMEELTQKPNLVKLFRQWEEDKIQGPRSWYWLKKYGKNSLPPEISEELKKREHDVDAFINGRLVTVTREDYFDFDKIKTKAMLFFRKEELESLYRLQAGIEKFSGVVGAQDLMFLVAGYIAELEENHDAALTAFQPLVTDEVNPLTEEALRRIASISMKLNDHANVLLALECLAGISPCYQTNFAEMLKLMGRNEEAAQVYSDYLTKAPDDLLAMLKLGQLYVNINANEAARMAFHYVLEADPENDTAKVLLKELEVESAK